MHLVINQVQFMTGLLADARRPWPQRVAVELPQRPEVQRQARAFPLTVAHTRRAAVNAHAMRTNYAAAMLATVRSTFSALAVERYRRGHAGMLPARLGDLVPGELGAVPIDPFSGHALRYAVFSDGYAVYSVGPNRTDDGGQAPGTQLRRGWETNQLADQPPDVGIRVRQQQTGHR
jgi:hypothetical protein